MKKLFVPLILFALSGMLLTSCSNSSKLAITKRHYRSGYYVDFGRRTTATASSVTNRHTRTIHEITPMAIAKPESYVGVNNTVVTLQKSNIYQRIAIPKNNKKIYSLNITSNSTSENTFKLNTKVTNDVSGISGDGNRRVDANVAFLVIVLCAIFIPPLGVGLMYGINSYFWIDLILTLLFFFPGMIFALIVVLM